MFFLFCLHVSCVKLIFVKDLQKIYEVKIEKRHIKQSEESLKIFSEQINKESFKIKLNIISSKTFKKWYELLFEKENKHSYEIIIGEPTRFFEIFKIITEEPHKYIEYKIEEHTKIRQIIVPFIKLKNKSIKTQNEKPNKIYDILFIFVREKDQIIYEMRFFFLQSPPFKHKMYKNKNK